MRLVKQIQHRGGTSRLRTLIAYENWLSVRKYFFGIFVLVYLRFWFERKNTFLRRHPGILPTRFMGFQENMKQSGYFTYGQKSIYFDVFFKSKLHNFFPVNHLRNNFCCLRLMFHLREMSLGRNTSDWLTKTSKWLLGCSKVKISWLF